jgi:serine/threonine protein kinase
MEYVEGGSLNKWLKTHSRPTCQQACAMLEDACRGLRFYYNNTNAPHGDIKLSNLLVTAEGRIKVGDFGSSYDIAKYSAESCTDSLSRDRWRKIGYVSDVYRLGGVFYFLLTGEQLPLHDYILAPDWADAHHVSDVARKICER